MPLPQPTEALLEVLSDALSAYQRAEIAVARAETLANVNAEIRGVNRLMDAVAAIDGYAVASSFPTYAALAEHAAAHVARWLCAA